MKLSMKAKKFTFNDKFAIRDENGNDKYFAKGELLSIGKKLHITDINGNEVASIQEKIISLKPKFYIFVNDEQVGEIIKERTMFKPKYKVTELGWVVKGDTSEHKYSILKDKKTIVTVKKKRISLSSSYVLDIENESDELTALAAVLAIDCVTADEKD